MEKRQIKTKNGKELFSYYPPLRSANLREANLSWADLSEADLSGANLRDANLRLANLREANLRLANLREAELRWADLRGADLSEANLRLADISEANLRRADLRWADLRGADLRWANLRGADISGANLRLANLSEANLHWADLRGADLREADLRDVDLRDADLNGAMLPYFEVCPPVGSFTAYKKTRGEIVLELFIPAEAHRTTSLVSRKCRASCVSVVGGERYDGSALCVGDTAISLFDPEFQYVVGQTSKCPAPFDDDIRVECASGLHFFVTKREARDFVL